MRIEAARIQEKINSFKRKYYLDLLIRGTILSLAILLVYFIIAAIIEYNLWLGPWARFLTFLSFFVIACYCVLKFLKEPLQWWVVRRGMSEEDSARLIGKFLPNVSDRLVNFVQLSNAADRDALAFASILQKSREFEPLSFESVIDVKQNKKYLKYLLIPVIVVFVILLIKKIIINQISKRFIKLKREY
jgi:hypothetical protein